MKNSTKVKIGGAIGLAALVAALNGDIRDNVSSKMGSLVDNLVYGRDVSTTKYRLAEHKIKYNETLWDIAHGNRMLIDYMRATNNIQDPTKLKTGDFIVVPVESSDADAKTLHELFMELYSNSPK